MTDAEGNPNPKTSETDPPAANQKADEPYPATPDDSPQAGDPGADDDTAGAGAMTEGSRGTGNLPDDAAGGVPTPGDSQGVAVPAVQAAAGTSEGAQPVEGVRIPANAAPGKPDGEVDTRA